MSPMDVDGVLLNFADAESMAVIKEKSVWVHPGKPSWRIERLAL